MGVVVVALNRASGRTFLTADGPAPRSMSSFTSRTSLGEVSEAFSDEASDAKRPRL
jgi:hypothetical protein